MISGKTRPVAAKPKALGSAASRRATIERTAHNVGKGASPRSFGDLALGTFGCCLAAGSVAFGASMAFHGPVASLGTSKDFTVFAQFAPRNAKPRAEQVSRREPTIRDGSSRPEADGGLDMTETASIPKKGDGVSPASDTTFIPSVTLEAISADAATIAVEGHTEIVHVGDVVPGAGQILAILPGSRPVLKTSRGLIVPAAN